MCVALIALPAGSTNVTFCPASSSVETSTGCHGLREISAAVSEDEDCELFDDDDDDCDDEDDEFDDGDDELFDEDDDELFDEDDDELFDDELFDDELFDDELVDDEDDCELVDDSAITTSCYFR